MGFQVSMCRSLYLLFVLDTPPQFECGIHKAWTSCHEYKNLTLEWRHDYEGQYSTVVCQIDALYCVHSAHIAPAYSVNLALLSDFLYDCEC